MKSATKIVLILVLALGLFHNYAIAKSSKKKVDKTLTAIAIISSKPDHIEVYIKNKEYRTPCQIRLKPGKYDIFGCQIKYDTYRRTHQLKKGKNKIQINLVLSTEIEPPEGAPPGKLLEWQTFNLPFENNHFYINLNGDKYGKYGLIIIPNFDFKMGDNPNEVFAKGWPTYEKYGKEALAWLNKKGLSRAQIKAKNITISWWGQEWWPEGKGKNLLIK